MLTDVSFLDVFDLQRELAVNLPRNIFVVYSKESLQKKDFELFRDLRIQCLYASINIQIS
jgi:hypothetical protein